MESRKERHKKQIEERNLEHKETRWTVDSLHWGPISSPGSHHHIFTRMERHKRQTKDQEDFRIQGDIEEGQLTSLGICIKSRESCEH